MRCAQRKVHTLHGDVFVVDSAWRAKLAQLGVSRDRDWAKFVGGHLVSTAPSTKCYRCDLEGGQTVYFKRYTYGTKVGHEFLVRPAKPAVELWAYSRLKELGIPTLDVLAFGERRQFGVLLAGFIVTEGIPDTMDLDEFTRTVWCHWPRARRITVARAIARVLLGQARTAHRSGFFHHDLKWRNILIDKSGDPDSLVWIDAPRASRMLFRERRGVITDLSGLARIAISLFSRFELMRFVHLYLGEEDRSTEAKRLFRQVQRHLGRRMPRPVDLPFPD